MDLAVAADVLCYISDLHPFLAAARRALAPQGLLAFSCEALENGEAGGGGKWISVCVTRAGAHGGDYKKNDDDIKSGFLSP